MCFRRERTGARWRPGFPSELCRCSPPEPAQTQLPYCNICKKAVMPVSPTKGSPRQGFIRCRVLEEHGCDTPGRVLGQLSAPHEGRVLVKFLSMCKILVLPSSSPGSLAQGCGLALAWCAQAPPDSSGLPWAEAGSLKDSCTPPKAPAARAQPPGCEEAWVESATAPCPGL